MIVRYTLPEVMMPAAMMLITMTWCLSVLPAGAQSNADALDSTSVVTYARAIVDTLSSPAYAGRGYLNDADGKSARFIEHQFKQMGLSPLGDTYQQPFPISVDVYPATPVLTVGRHQLTIGSEFLPFPGSAGGTVTAGRVVHAGDGLFIPGTSYNDYAGKQLDQAIAVINLEISSDVLQQVQADSSLNPAFVQATTRIEIARRLGATAVILLTKQNLMDFYSPINVGIPALIVKQEAWPQPDPDTATLGLHTNLDWQTTTSNVIAYIQGTALPDSYYLITAHYDHMGQLGPDHYFPGANDNASGVALTLALAAYFKKHPLKRSIIFTGFSGEEEGLKGSRYFVDNPPIPLTSIRFLINLDMVASGREGIIAVGGSDYEEEFEHLRAVGEDLGIRPVGKRPNAPNSDQYFFLNAGVRGFFLYTNKGDQPYHHPDDIAATLNWGDFMHTFMLVRTFLSTLDQQENR